MTSGARSFAVIGLGAFGGAVADELSGFGAEVLAVDRDEARVALFADTVTEAVIADARDERALRDAGLGGFDVAVIGIGEDLEGCVIAAMNARLLGVEVVWARARDRMHHRILSKLGVDRVVEPEQSSGQRVAQMLHNPLVRDYASLGNGFHVVNIVADARLGGRTLGDLALGDRFDLRCLGLMRAGAFLDPAADVGIAEDDRLLLLGRRAALRAFTDGV